MSYPKPLASKTLDKLYANAGINDEKKEFLHKLFLVCCNLYGIITIRDLWQIYTENELELFDENPKLKRKDLVEFAAIVRREDVPYYIYEIDELYSAEERRPLYRFIVNKDLVGTRGMFKFTRIYELVEEQVGKPFYVDENLFDYIRHVASNQEKAMQVFLDNLEVGDMYIADENGKELANPNYGKKLSEFVFHTRYEKFNVKYLSGECPDGPKRRSKHLDKVLEEINVPESTKLMNNISWYIQSLDDYKSGMQYIIEELVEVGVNITEEKMEKFAELYFELSNNTRMMCNRGWTPNELHDLCESLASIENVSSCYS